MAAVPEILVKEVPRLRRFAFSLTASSADADDLVQDVVVRVLEKGLPEHDDPVPWLITLCKNLWVDRVRQRKGWKRADEKRNLVQPVTYMEPVESLQREKLLAKIQELPEASRMALELVAIEGFSYAEAADILKIPLGTVMSRVARAREKMLASFDSDEISL